MKLTVKQAAAAAQISSSLIYVWCRERLLPHYRFGGKGKRGRILIDPADLEKMLKEQKVEQHPLLR